MEGTVKVSPVCFYAALCLVCANAARAQDNQIDEIVVTASKRGESTLLETPMSIQAISGDDLEQRGIDQFIDFARSISGLSFEDQGPGDKEIVLRGLQSTGAATTGLYFDDIVMTSNHRQDGGGRQPDIKLVDMERIEVLKGPQGTLYGASSMGGTVRMITNKPDPSEVAGAFNLDVGATDSGSDPNYQVDAMLNVPIVEDKLAIRVVGYDSERTGFIDDLLVGKAGFYDGEGVNNAVVSGGRVALRWNVNDRITLDLMGIRQDTNSNGPAWYQPAYGEFVQRNYVAAPWEETLRSHNVALEWEADHGVFTATASRMQRDIFYTFPATRILCTIFAGSQGLDREPCLSPGPDPRVAVPAGPTPTGYASWSAVDQPQDREIISSEIRYASLWSGPTQLIAGLYFQSEENTFRSQVIDVLNMEGDRSPFVGGLNVDRLTNTQIDQFAAFGELSYEFTEALTATVGVRAFNFDIDELGQNFADRGGPESDPVLTSSSEDDVNFKFNLAYGADDDDLTLYATFSQGFRSGGNNEPDFATGTVFPPFQSDTLNNYEIGAKGRFFDGAVRLDASAYYMDWSDLQARGLFSGLGGTTFLILDNIGDAVIEGIEIGALASPFVDREFRVGGTLSLMNAELATDTAVQTGPNTGQKGDRIPNVPEITGNIYGEYGFSLRNDWSLLARVDYSYVGESFSDFRPNTLRYQPQGDYSLVDVRATFSLDDRYRIALYVDNVFNENAVVTYSADANLRRPDQIIPVRPRTFGISLGYEF